RIVALLRQDPAYLQIHEAISGLRRSRGDARLAARAWTDLAARAGRTRVRAVARSAPEGDDAELARLGDEVRALDEQIRRAQAELDASVRAGTLAPADAEAQKRELAGLRRDAATLADRTEDASRAAIAALPASTQPELVAMIATDRASAVEL